MGKSQIESLTQISNLSRTGFISFTQISQFKSPFSSNPKSFTVKSQIKCEIFHKIKNVTGLSIESQDSDI